MIKRVRIYLILIILFYSLLVLAQSSIISVESRVDKAKITIGDLINYSVIVRHAPEITLEDLPAGTNLGMFEVRDYQAYEPKKEQDKIIQEYQFVISTFETGDFVIPPLTIRYTVGSDTTYKELKTEKIKIVVESLKPSEAGDIREIKPPLEIPRNYRQIIFIASVVLIILAIGILAYLFIKRYKEGKSILTLKPKPPRPAHELALEALDKLRQKDLLSQGEVKQFYIEISDIIRRYIEGRFNIVALEMTTFQLLDNMHQGNINQEYIEMVAEFLELSDLAKFAKYIPAENENQMIIQIAYDFVHKTKIVREAIIETEEIKKPVETEKEDTEKILEVETGSNIDAKEGV